MTIPTDANVFEIEEGTPAAEALRANADVRVTKVGKVARYLHVQSVRRTAKSILHVGTGAKRGKPPRVPELTDDEFVDELRRLDVLLEHENESELDHMEAEEHDRKMSPKTPSGGEGEIGEGQLDDEEMKRSLHSSNHHAETSPILMNKSSDSSDSHVPYKVASFHKGQKLTLLDTKGKKREVRLDRKLKKKMKKREKKRAKRNYVKGKVIDGHHELYTLSIAMMLGLRYSIFLTNNQIAEDKKNNRMWLDSDEFMKVEKYIFRPDGRNNTPPHQLSHTFKFKDYSPLPFAFIRRMFGINEYEFHHSVCGNANFIEFISNAKSGQFFFYSSDGRYMIKTMTNQESKFLRRILPHYFRHCAQNPNTILTKFLGMYRVKLYHLRKNVKFVIMNSVFDTDKVLSSFYDLKGSVIGRKAKKGESVLKDNDLRKDKDGKIRLPNETRERLREQVRRDCQFLKDMKIMDYSMLVGIHYIPSKSAMKKDINGLKFRGSSVRKPQKLERSRSDQDNISPLVSDGRHHSRSKSTDSINFGMYHDAPGSKSNDFSMYHDDTFSYQSGPSSFRAVPDNVARQSAPHNSPFDDPMKNSERSVTSTGSLQYDEDDEISLLGKIGSSYRTIDPKTVHQGTYDAMGEDFIKERKAIEMRRELAIEQSYWPFHRHYELNGDRRVIKIKANNTASGAESSDDMKMVGTVCAKSCLGDFTANDPDLNALRENLILDDFVPPISSRRDGGLLMETKGLNLPLKVKAGGKVQKCDGKIYYMGIIDILQQFNTRKRLEARLRKMKGGAIAASCVHPQVYADRFVRFFDEYTLGTNDDTKIFEEDDGVEEVVFEPMDNKNKKKDKKKQKHN